MKWPQRHPNGWNHWCNPIFFIFFSSVFEISESKWRGSSVCLCQFYWHFPIIPFFSLSLFLSFFLSLSHPFQMRSPEIHISVFDASLNNNSLMNSCRWVVISLTSFDTKWTSVIWVQWRCFATELNFSNN